jgi:hypothetical protein
LQTESPFERNTTYLSAYSSVRNINIVKKSSIQVRQRSRFSLVRKSSMLEAGESSILFPMEN